MSNLPENKLSKNKKLTRRLFLSYFKSIGISSILLPNILFVKCDNKKDKKITRKMIKDAEQIAGLNFTEEEREKMVNGLNNLLDKYEALRKIPLDNSIPPALRFDPIVSGMSFENKSKPIKISKIKIPNIPSNIEELAFLPVTHLSMLIKSRKISSKELTQMYLSRIKKYDSKIQSVITLTEELAIKQAEKADKEIAKGIYRGPLHGIPWGVKDLFSAKGYKTTWGAMPYKDQIIDKDATVVKRLEEKGAVLLAKLSTGALAYRDNWFGGTTKNPWNLEEGSDGSSAGPGAATSAGFVGFSVGTETLGSIISPSTRCGVTGLRTSFGRISRYGAMTLSWSMDKIGPMCRSVEDCALVLNAICGPDGKDRTVTDIPFNWDCDLDIKKLHIGYIKSAFEEKRKDKELQANDEATLEKLRSMGINLIPIELPDFYAGSLTFIYRVEAAAAFDELTRTNKDKILVKEGESIWPNTFRESRMIPAVEYIQANRLRTIIMEKMAETMADIDVYVVPSESNKSNLLTNATGYPALVLPNGFRKKGTLTSITFIGKLYGEAKLLSVAKAYQDSTNFHLKHPVL